MATSRRRGVCSAAALALAVALAACWPLSATGVVGSPAAGRSRRVFAHYLPWYSAAGGDGWTYVDAGGTRVPQYVSAPAIGEYSQRNASVLEYHLLTAAVSGLDGFVVNWDPRSAAQTTIISDVFAAATRLPGSIRLDPGNPASAVAPRVFVSYDYQGTDYDPAMLRGHFQQIKDLWAASPVYFRDDNTGDDGAGPVVVMLWNDGATAAYSAAARAVFGAGNVTLVTRNAVFGNANQSLSAGAFEWPQPQTAGAGYDPENFGQGYLADFEWRMAHQVDYGKVLADRAQTLMMGAVWPGFNDSNVPASWNQGVTRWLPREVDGVRTANLTWERQLAYVPAADPLTPVQLPWVQVVTWNDFPEGTTVEPAAAGSVAAAGAGPTGGYADLLRCRAGAFQFKGLGDGGASAADGGLAAVRVPLWILEARSHGHGDMANASVALLAQGLYANASAAANAWRCGDEGSGCAPGCAVCASGRWDADGCFLPGPCLTDDADNNNGADDDGAAAGSLLELLPGLWAAAAAIVVGQRAGL